MKPKTNKTTLRECKVHGISPCALRTNGQYRCRKCAVDATTKRRRLVKVKSVEYKGGCCQICGYNRCNASLAFHHLDPDQKDVRIGRGNTVSWERTKAELDKCALLCHNCHNEVHAGMHPNFLIDKKTGKGIF